LIEYTQDGRTDGRTDRRRDARPTLDATAQRNDVRASSIIQTERRVGRVCHPRTATRLLTWSGTCNLP